MLILFGVTYFVSTEQCYWIFSHVMKGLSLAPFMHARNQGIINHNIWTRINRPRQFIMASSHICTDYWFHMICLHRTYFGITRGDGRQSGIRWSLQPLKATIWPIYVTVYVTWSKDDLVYSLIYASFHGVNWIQKSSIHAQLEAWTRRHSVILQAPRRHPSDKCESMLHFTMDEWSLEVLHQRLWANMIW